MSMTTALLGGMLFCQLLPPATTTTDSQPVDPPALYRKFPPEIVAECLALPPGHSLDGQPVSLMSALTYAPDRMTQRETIRAYWRLTEAVASYNLCFTYDEQVGELAKTGDAQMLVSAARAASSASLREAQLAVVSAQHDLASTARLPSDAPLPLPADPPHVGPYMTQFDRLFENRTPPATAVLINRTIPIQCRAIDNRAAAIQAAEEALVVAEDSFKQGDDARQVLTCMKQCRQQRRALISAVCRYNRDITDYAIAVVPPTTNAEGLVRMLIKPAVDPLRPIVSPVDGMVQPVGAEEPIKSPPSAIELPSQWTPSKPTEKSVPTPAPPREIFERDPEKNVPTPAPPRDEEAESPAKNVPTPAPPRDRYGLEPGTNVPTPAPRDRYGLETEENVPTPAPPRDRYGLETEKNVPTPAPPRDEAIEPAEESEEDAPKPAPPRDEEADVPAANVPRLAPLPALEPIPEPRVKPLEPHKVERPVSGFIETTTQTTATGVYPALLNETPAVQAKKLTDTLHWNRSLPEDSGQPLSLDDCLQRCSPMVRAAAIEAYWDASQNAAEYNLFVQKAQMLDEIAINDGSVDSFLLLSAAKSNSAAVDETLAALIESQFKLAGLLGPVTDRAWPLPSTAPHSGQYSLRLENQPSQLLATWPMRRLAATIPAMSESVRLHASAVVKTDASRAAGAVSVQGAIEDIDVQTEQTLAFLNALTEYNLAIAEYVLEVLPPNASSERLAAALVTK